MHSDMLGLLKRIDRSLGAFEIPNLGKDRTRTETAAIHDLIYKPMYGLIAKYDIPADINHESLMSTYGIKNTDKEIFILLAVRTALGDYPKDEYQQRYKLTSERMEQLMTSCNGFVNDLKSSLRMFILEASEARMSQDDKTAFIQNACSCIRCDMCSAYRIQYRSTLDKFVCELLKSME